MRPSKVHIFTFFSLLGSALSIPHHVNRNLNGLIPRQTNDSSSSSSTHSSTSSASSTTASSSSQTPTSTPTSTIPSSTPTATPTPSPTSSQPTPSSTPSSTSSTSSIETSSTQSSSSTPRESTSTTPSTSQSTSSTSSTLAFSDLTNTALSLPTSFTSTFASTASDGSSITVTAVVSRPTGAGVTVPQSAAKKGFFSNTGAVAGTFVVVGLFGTGLLLCVGLWVFRRYRRRRNDQVYFEEEYKEFNDHNLSNRNGGTTPDLAMPPVRGSGFSTPVPSSPGANMIERLHGEGSTAVPTGNGYSDHTQELYRNEGEFDPYQVHDGGYAYSEGHGGYPQYPQYGQDSEHGQQEPTAYAYQPQPHAEHQQAAAGPSHAQHQSLDSFYQVDPTFQGSHAR